MLNRDLISVRHRKGVIQPALVPVTSPVHLDTAWQLISAYRQAAAQRQSANSLAEYLSPLIDGSPNRRQAQALQKLLDERCTFSTNNAIDYPAMRTALFQVTTQLLQGDAPLGSMEEFQDAAASRLAAINPEFATAMPYGDLPENNVLEKFDDIEPRQLLERYNVALVQGLLLSASKLEVWLETSDAPQLRRIFKYLRFFQLLATIENDSQPEKGSANSLQSLHFIVDGPSSILEQSKRYGLQLAVFFPAICTAEFWRIRAKIHWQDQPVTLELDNSSELVCPYHNFAAYVPDEIKLFQQHFQDKVTDWKFVTDTPLLRGAGKEFIIPDFSFRKGRKTVHLELFNRWHANYLQHRLDWLAKHPTAPIIIGVDRSIIKKDPALAEELESSEWFQQRGFLYRDYPTCDKVLRLLNNFQRK